MARTELKMSEAEFAIRQIKTDMTDGISTQTYQYLCKLAKEWGVHVTGIAWLGMKPYPMQGALYQMLMNRCDKEGLLVKGMVLKNLKRAEPNDKRAGFEADITLFNQRGFDEMMKGATLDKLTVELLREAREIMTHHYHEEGWASLETVKAPNMQNPDYLNHMAATRALDRTLRMIVRCPFTAASEMPEGLPGELAAGLPGFDNPPGEGDGAAGGAQVTKPGGKAAEAPAGEAKPEGETAKPAKPGKSIPDKPIKPIKKKDGDPKEQKINEKQATLATLQWEEYCKTAAPSLEKKEIEEKRNRLIRALFGKDAVGDLTVAQLEEWVGMMQRKEIDIVPEGTEPPEKVEIKT